MRGDASGIREQTDALIAVTEHKLAGLASIVGDRVGADMEITDRKRFEGVNQVHVRGIIRTATALLVGPGRKPNRELPRPCHTPHPGTVVSVLVGEKDAVELITIEAQARQPRARLLDGETAVDQQARTGMLDDECVSPTTAAKRCKSHPEPAGAASVGRYLS